MCVCVCVCEFFNIFHSTRCWVLVTLTHLQVPPRHPRRDEQHVFQRYPCVSWLESVSYLGVGGIWMVRWLAAEQKTMEGWWETALENTALLVVLWYIDNFAVWQVEETNIDVIMLLASINGVDILRWFFLSTPSCFNGVAEAGLKGWILSGVHAHGELHYICPRLSCQTPFSSLFNARFCLPFANLNAASGCSEKFQNGK